MIIVYSTAECTRVDELGCDQLEKFFRLTQKLELMQLYY